MVMGHILGRRCGRSIWRSCLPEGEVLVVGFVSAKRRPNPGYRQWSIAIFRLKSVNALDRESGGPSKLRINKSAALHIRWRSTLRHYKRKRMRSFGRERAKRCAARRPAGGGERSG